MLFQLVENTCRRIEAIDFKLGIADLGHVLRSNAPDTLDALARDRSFEGSADPRGAATILAATVVAVAVRGVPMTARHVAAKVQDQRIAASRRCGLAGILAYLVQPHDLLHDDSPSGYGYLDDTILLRAAVLEYLSELPAGAQNIEGERELTALLAALAPPQARPLIQQQVSLMSTGLQLMSLLDGPIAEIILQQIVANPLQSTTPGLQPGWSPRPAPDYSRGRTFGSFWVEGNDIVMPGGPALINGQLFIP